VPKRVALRDSIGRKNRWTTARMRDATCQRCGKSLLDDFLGGRVVWSKGRSRYYCDECKNDLFNGVRLR